MFTLPLTVAIQEGCARRGLVTAKQPAMAAKTFFCRRISLSVASLVLAATTITIAIEIGTAASAATLLRSVTLVVPNPVLR